MRRNSFSERPADSSYDAWVSAQRRNVKRFSEEIAAAINATH
jgi:pyridoxine/pyridoxamine 5'-phosphate oxidase